MPAYIKVYYAFAIYLLLACVGAGIWLIYNIFFDHITSNAAGRISMLIMCVGLVCMLLKGVVSIKACRHYRQATQITNQQRDVFMAAYWFIVFFAAGSFLYCVSIIQDEGDHIFRYYASHFKARLIDSYVLLGTIVSFYFAVTDLILLKAIRKKYEAGLLSFDTQVA